jgi:hypothetical protein
MANLKPELIQAYIGWLQANVSNLTTLTIYGKYPMLGMDVSEQELLELIDLPLEIRLKEEPLSKEQVKLDPKYDSPSLEGNVQFQASKNATREASADRGQLDFAAATEAALVKIKSEGFIETCLAETIKQTFERVLRDSFGEYSPFSRQVREHIARVLKINLAEFSLPEYSQMIVNIYSGLLSQNIVAGAKASMEKAIKNILAPLEPKMLLSGLIERLKAFWSEYEDPGELEGRKIGLEVAPETLCHGQIYYYRVYIDERERIKECDYAIRLMLDVTDEYQDKSDPEKYAVAHEDYRGKGAVEARVSAVSHKGVDYAKMLHNGNFKGLDQFLFRLYAQGVIVIMDESSVDESYDG